MNKIVETLLIGMMLTVGANVARAGPLEDSFAASKRGDFATAVRLLRSLAEQGNAEAQFNLGNMYSVGGYGVPQDFVRSHMWLTVSRARAVTSKANAGIELLLRGVTAKMTPAQIELAQKMAKQCEKSNYKNCDELESNQTSFSAVSVPMHIEGGIYVVPVLINGTIPLDFVVDSGAADVSIPADVIMVLMRTGTLEQSDFLGQRTYQLADGSTVPSELFRIRTLNVGGKVFENVTGSVASVKSPLLLGQSFLGRFKSWKIDNTQHALVFE
jgi:predicted aspartyl protease